MKIMTFFETKQKKNEAIQEISITSTS